MSGTNEELDDDAWDPAKVEELGPDSKRLTIRVPELDEPMSQPPTVRPWSSEELKAPDEAPGKTPDAHPTPKT